jgi:hypothetical protein
LANAPPLSQDGRLSVRGGMSDLDDEEAWLRAWIIRLRTLLRFAIHPEVETGLKQFIADAERRLERLQQEQIDPFEDAPGG